MRISLFLNRLFTGHSVKKSKFEKEIPKLMRKSEEAMQELSNEGLNSETLKAIFMPNFKPKNPGRMMAVSTKVPSQPVEVGYKINQNGKYVTIKIFSNEPQKELLGQKQFLISQDRKGRPLMLNGCMSSEEEACKKAGVKGIGIIEDILQVKCAIENGINKIPCYSRAKATLFHIKMGFKPNQWLEEINSLFDIERIMKGIIYERGSDVSPKHYTPIIVSKGSKQKKYFLDTNTTQCIANIRQIKENYKKGITNGPRPFLEGVGIDMTLEGENYDFWKRNVKEMFSKV